MAKKKPNCVKNGIPYHRVRETFGKKDDGTANRQEFYGLTYTEAKAKRDAYADSWSAGVKTNLAEMTVGDAMKAWLFTCKRMDHDLKASSFVRYESIYRNYVEGSSFAKTETGDATPIGIQEYINKLSEDKTDPKTYSQLRNLYKVLRMFFFYALENGYIGKTPCRKISIPGKRPEKLIIEIFTAEEIALIKEELTRWNSRDRFIILLALGTGMRQGELLALKYSDFANDEISVTKSLAFPTTIDKDGNRSRQATIWETKTDSSVRTLPFPKSLARELEKHKARQATEFLKLGLGKPEYVFTTSTGAFVDPTNLHTAFNRLLARSGVSHRKFHALRHTFATNLVMGGAPLPLVQELMGHSKLEMTMVYTHPEMRDKKEAIKSLDALLL